MSDADMGTVTEVVSGIEQKQDKPKDCALGVLLVHGIGRQLCGDTLVRWGDILLKTIQDATRNKVQAHVERAGRSRETAQDRLITAEIRLRSSKEKEETWLLADGWWADVFIPPSYGELVSWSVRALPWAIAIHLSQHVWKIQEQDKTPTKYLHVAIAVFRLLAGLALAPFFVLFLASTLALGLLPIPQMRSVILAMQGTLVSTMGDCLAFVESPLRAGLIRTRILDRLGWLKKRCDRTIIVAHSQGAAVVLDALGAIGDGDPVAADSSSPGARTAADAPDTLVTFGAGTNQLTSLKRLSEGAPSKLGVNPVAYAMGALLALGGIIAWLCVAAFLQHTNATKILFAAGSIVAWYAVLVLMILAVEKLIQWLGKRWKAFLKHKEKIYNGALSTVFLAMVLPSIFFIGKSGLPIFPLFFVFLAVFGLIAGVRVILSPETKAAVTMVTVPPKLGRWIDLYALADPVPEGPTRLQTGSGGREIEPSASAHLVLNDSVPTQTESSGPKFTPIPISNLGSFVGDHTSYWDNLDGFVLQVVRACAETAGSSWTRKLPTELPEVAKRAAWRVGWLRLARYAIYLGWLVAAVGLWSFHGNAIPFPFKLPAWLPTIATTTLRLAIFSAVIILAASVTVGLVRFIWRRWVRSEQLRVLAHQAVGGEEFWRLVAMGFVVWLVIGFAYLAVTDRLSSLARITVVQDIVLLMFGPAVVTVIALAWWWWPGPEVPGRNS